MLSMMFNHKCIGLLKVVAETWLTTFWIANTKQLSVICGHVKHRIHVFTTENPTFNGANSTLLRSFKSANYSCDPKIKLSLLYLHLVIEPFSSYSDSVSQT